MGKFKLKNISNISARHKRRLIANATKIDIERLYQSVPIKISATSREEMSDTSVTDYGSFRESSSNSNKNSQINLEDYETDLNPRLLDLHDNNSSFKENSNDNMEENIQSPIMNLTEATCNNNDVREKLVTWALSYNIKQNAVSALLHILNEHIELGLPNDARTLLTTPRITNVVDVGSGQYVHLGLGRAIKNMLQVNKSFEKLDLLINIDGLPISKSSNACLWPILCSEKQIKKVYIVGVYYGTEKPTDVRAFLQRFVDEATSLVNDGFKFNDKVCKINVWALICDAPAKSLVLSVKGHTGYNSCTKCRIEGEYINNRICFPSNSSGSNILRTERDFIEESVDDPRVERSVLLNIPNFSPLLNVPLDYMHLVCLGVVKKLILLWLQGKPLSIRIPGIRINAISRCLLKCSRTTPKEMSRKPRSLSEINHWKATEFRMFLLYVGPVVLHSQLDNDIYLNFLTLHVAVRILCNSIAIKNTDNVNYADQLLHHFVTTFGKIYGIDKISHNVHNLLHVANDSKTFGTLDEYSAFHFESFMFAIKKLIRKNEKPLQQLARRYSELELLTFHDHSKTTQLQLKEWHEQGPLLSSISSDSHICQYKICQNESFIIDCKKFKDRCVCFKNGEIFEIRNIIQDSIEKSVSVVGKPFIKLRNFYEIPCESGCFDIYVVNSNKSAILELRFLSDIKYKLWIMPYTNESTFVTFPILHSGY